MQRPIKAGRIVMAAALAPFGAVVHRSGGPGHRRPAARILGAMSRETLNLICSELPGAERDAQAGADLWAAAHEPFARVEPDGITVAVLEDGAWSAVGPDASVPALRERIVGAYLAARERLPAEVQPTLDRTSG